MTLEVTGTAVGRALGTEHRNLFVEASCARAVVAASAVERVVQTMLDDVARDEVTRFAAELHPDLPPRIQVAHTLVEIQLAGESPLEGAWALGMALFGARDPRAAELQAVSSATLAATDAVEVAVERALGDRAASARLRGVFRDNAVFFAARALGARERGELSRINRDMVDRAGVSVAQLVVSALASWVPTSGRVRLEVRRPRLLELCSRFLEAAPGRPDRPSEHLRRFAAAITLRDGAFVVAID